MKNNKKTRPSEEYFAELLLVIFDFMMASGLTKSAVSRLSSIAIRTAARASVPGRIGESGGLAGAALILDAWHRRPRYIDELSRPRAIPLAGRGLSIEALIKTEIPGANARKIAQQLRVLGLVTPVGSRLYVPIGPIARISELHPLVQKHVADAIVNLLQTVKTNVEAGMPSGRLLERFAEVPDLPKSLVREFQQFSEEQGWAFLRTLNDWLESRRSTRSRKGTRSKSVRAGVQVYAYISAPSPNRPQKQ